MNNGSVWVAWFALVCVVLAGCLGPVEDDVPTVVEPPIAMDDLDAGRLYQESAVLTQDGPGWQVVRLRVGPEHWLVDQEDNGYTAWLHVPFFVEPLGNDYTFIVAASKFLDRHEPYVQSVAVDSSTPMWISMGQICQGACGVFNATGEVIFLVGSESTGGRLHYGLTDVAQIEEAAALAARAAIPLAPDATGQHAHAGSITSFRSDTEQEHTVVGRFNLSQSELLPTPEGIQVRHESIAEGHGPESGPGTGGLIMGLREGAGVTQWDLQLRFGNDEASMDDVVVWAGLPVAGVTNHRTTFTTGPGDAELRFALEQSVLTPTVLPPAAVLHLTHRMHLSWWHADVDLEALYGWELPSLESGVAPETSDPDPDRRVFFCGGHIEPCGEMEARSFHGES